MQFLQSEEGIEDRVITRDLVPWHLVDVLTLLHDVGVVTVFGDQLQLVVVVVVLQVVAHGVVLVDAGVAVERDEVRPLELLLLLRVPSLHDLDRA